MPPEQVDLLLWQLALHRHITSYLSRVAEEYEATCSRRSGSVSLNVQATGHLNAHLLQILQVIRARLWDTMSNVQRTCIIQPLERRELEHIFVGHDPKFRVREEYVTIRAICDEAEQVLLRISSML